MIIDTRKIQLHDKAEQLNLRRGYTHFYGNPQPEEMTKCI